MNSFIVDFMSRHPSVFIRRHLILIKGKEGAAVGREVETIQHMFLTSREETSSVLMVDVCVYQATSRHRLRLKSYI